MSVNKWFVPVAIMSGLVLGLPAFAAEPHAHGDAGVIELQLDHGKKWQTDAPLRRGMGEIRAAMAKSLPPIHKKTFTPAQYGALAARVEKQVVYMVGNCKLPEEADQQLHLVLAQINDGVDEMKGASDRDRGAEKIVRALAQYGQYFNHPGWRPLAH
ncbi:MAG: hypothetical protein LBE33_09885 [Zoogloeaceae bacterium]|jgi:hypothetical protein|nr:hypothetical protein [Zoogloeaceae bacterium]